MSRFKPKLPSADIIEALVECAFKDIINDYASEWRRYFFFSITEEAHVNWNNMQPLPSCPIIEPVLSIPLNPLLNAQARQSPEDADRLRTYLLAQIIEAVEAHYNKEEIWRKQ